MREFSKNFESCERRKTMKDPRDCWAGEGQVNRYGFVRNKDGKYAHYVAYAEHLNVKELDGLPIFQTCHNRRCTNPTHLKQMSLTDYILSLWHEGYFRELNPPKTLLMKELSTPNRLVKRIRVLWLKGYDLQEIKWRIPGVTLRQILYHLFPNDMRVP